MNVDLRPYQPTPAQIDRAKLLAFSGLLNHQPFIFDDRFAVGAGLSFFAGYTRDVPTVYCPDGPPPGASPEYAARVRVGTEDEEAFVTANERIRRFYDGLVEQVARVCPVQRASVLDVGANAGYFPLAFLLRGVRRAVGIDRVDYGETLRLLGEICHVKPEFRAWTYDGSFVAPDSFDIVVSVAVLVHLSDPLRHLAWLGSAATRALLVFTSCHQDEGCSIRYHAANRYYGEDEFPFCFDVTTLSKPLLRVAFERMGFDQIHDVEPVAGSIPDAWRPDHLGLLGVRSKPGNWRARPRREKEAYSFLRSARLMRWLRRHAGWIKRHSIKT